MRQVKFRYWNGSKVLNQEAIINHLNKYIARNDKHLMQFTGLFDKQGVEIYEGDIIKGGIYLSYEVKWDYEQSGWNIGTVVKEYYEVIGNIYENSDPIKKEQG